MGSPLARNTLWMLLGFGFRLGLQFLYFVLLARILGPEQYGAFVGVAALIMVLSPFASWGSGNILIKHASRDPGLFKKYWGAALATTLASGGALTGLAFLLSGFVFTWETALALALPIALGDLVGIRLADVSGQAFQSRERLSRTSAIWALISAARLLGVLVLYALPEASAAQWALLYAGSGLLAGALGVAWVTRELGLGPLSLGPMRGEWREGFYFAISLAAQGAYNDLDKTLLSRFVSDVVAGGYAAAYRVLDAAFVPMRALLYATYPRFFREGKKGLGGSWAFALRLLPWGLAAGGLGTALALGLAPFLPILLGPEYALSAAVLPLLAPILLFRALHYLAADALTGAGYQGLRSAVQVGVAFLNLGLNLWWIPLFGWRGAVWSSLASDGLLAASLLLALFLGLGRRARVESYSERT
ncbi:polysaccharide biosynthesis protein [Thermus thermophilus]|nr:polysaccharide biosynthesis protein [Thermus thermophilus]